MTTAVQTVSQSVYLRYGFVAIVLVVGVIAVGAFVFDTSDATPSPVPFEMTTDTGLAAEERQELTDRGLTIPEVQVFYSQYQFVVGYSGVEHAVSSLSESGHEQQFGYPIAVYVSDFTGTEMTLSDEGYLDAAFDPTWTDAEEASFVIESDARTPTGETAIPFSESAAAEEFVDSYGGTVVDWQTLQRHEFDIDDATVVRDRVSEQERRADVQIAAVRPLADRETELVVGVDGDTIQETINNAPPNATVRVPAGTYDEHPTINESIALVGEGATIRGDGNGSVIDITSDNVAITGLTVTGVGNETDAPENVVSGDVVDEDPPADETETDDPAADDRDGQETDASADTETVDGWDATVELAYGYADAGIVAVDTEGLYLSDITVETPANGILLRDVSQTGIENVTVTGTEDWMDGLMGLMSVRSPVVVQDSTFDRGRDGVYLHRAPNSTVRNSTFTDNRFGVHYMYTSDALVANTTMRGQEASGITIMTDSTHNAVVGNDVRDAAAGILPSGSRSYFAENVLADNSLGLSTAAGSSLYERNVVYGNDVGIRAGSLQPSNRVLENDFVANDQPATTSTGPLYLWSHDGVGNYWDGHHPQRDVYIPTDPVQGSQHRTDGATALAASPAATLLDSFRDTTPGMRDATIVDTTPQSAPVQPAVIASLRGEDSD